MVKKLVVGVLALVLSLTLVAQQSSDELKKKQAEIQQEIDELRRTLNETKKNTKAGLGQLAMVKKKIRLREQAIGNINQQINMIEGSINQSRNEISRLKKELDTLKRQYEKSVVYAYKNRSNYDFLNFIFSASNFSDALKRIEYLKSYRLYREQQAETIKNTQSLLTNKISGLEVTRKQKDDALEKQQKEKLVLVDERKEKDDIVKSLKAREKELSKELTAKAKADARLRSSIKSAIDREIRLAREKALAEAREREARERERAKAEAASKPAASSSSTAAAKKVEKPATRKESVLESTPEGLALSGNFERNRGKLPWPVEKGNIKVHFGTYSIEGTNLRGNNPGLTLTTEIGAPVKAVFDGEVSSIFDVDGNWGVMVRHGKYFTVYSNLSATSVSRNQKIVTGQMLGRAGSSDEGSGEIEFIIMQEKSNLNPESWIRGR